MNQLNKCYHDGESELNCCIRLTFKTLEERMRHLQGKAGIGHVYISTKENSRSDLGWKNKSEEEMQQTKDLVVYMKFLFQSIFIFVAKPNSVGPLHKILNRSQPIFNTAKNVVLCLA